MPPSPPSLLLRATVTSRTLGPERNHLSLPLHACRPLQGLPPRGLAFVSLPPRADSCTGDPSDTPQPPRVRWSFNSRSCGVDQGCGCIDIRHSPVPPDVQGRKWVGRRGYLRGARKHAHVRPGCAETGDRGRLSALVMATLRYHCRPVYGMIQKATGHLFQVDSRGIGLVSQFSRCVWLAVLPIPDGETSRRHSNGPVHKVRLYIDALVHITSRSLVYRHNFSIQDIISSIWENNPSWLGFRDPAHFPRAVCKVVRLRPMCAP